MGSNVTKLHNETSDYIQFVKYVNAEKTKFTDINLINQFVENYIEQYEGIIESKEIKWIQFVHKLNPLDYHNNILDKDKLTKSVIKQTEYCFKIIDLISNNYSYKKWKYAYCNFLKLCKLNNNITIPTLEEDFMWHAHMSNHNKYYKDCINMFGKILDHDDTLSEKDIEKYTKERKKLEATFYPAFFFIFNPSSSICGSHIVSSCGNHCESNCGSNCGSSCGSSCGSN